LVYKTPRRTRLEGFLGMGTGFRRSELWRLAYLDNEQAGTHSRGNPVDTWADYAQPYDPKTFNQEKMATMLGVSQPIVSKRLRANSFPDSVKDAVFDGKIEEGHAFEILDVYSMSNNLESWLSR